MTELWIMGKIIYIGLKLKNLHEIWISCINAIQIGMTNNGTIWYNNFIYGV